MRQETRDYALLKIAMVHQPGYQAAAGRVFDYLLSVEGSCSGTSQPSQTMIATATGLVRETVSRAVTWLRRYGYVWTRQRAITQRDGTRLKGTLVYRLTRDTIQAGILVGRGLRERYQMLLKRGQRRSTWEGVKNPAFPRCDLESATPSRSEFITEKSYAREAISATPELLRAMRQRGWTG